MRNSWKEVKLGDICNIQLGKTPARKDDNYWDKLKVTNNTWVSISDLKHGEIISESEEHVSDLAIKKMNITPKGTLMLSFKLTIGRVSFAGKDLYTNEAIASLLNLDKNVSDKYLYYFFSYFDWTKQTEGDIKVKGRTLNKTKLKKLPIVLPPFPEQKRIVSILNKAFTGIDQVQSNIERNIENAEELFQSKLNEVFDGTKGLREKKRIGDLTYVKSGGTPSRSNNEYWEDGTIPWYSSGELNGLFTKESERLITQKGLDGSNAKLFPEGSLLIGMYDTAALKMSILDRDGTFNQAISGVKPNDGINLQFVMLAINAQKSELLKLRRGIRQKNLNLTKIKAISIPIPKIEEQNEVVSQLHRLNNHTQNLKSKYQEKLSYLTNLKKSLLQKAFSGELTAKEEITA